MVWVLPIIEEPVVACRGLIVKGFWWMLHCTSPIFIFTLILFSNQTIKPCGAASVQLSGRNSVIFSIIAAKKIKRKH